MNRDKNGFVIFDDDFRREFMTPEELALSDKHTEELKQLLAKRDSGEISAQVYNKLSQKLDALHEFDWRCYSMKNLTTWENVRDKFMTDEEKSECDKWLAELGKLMDKLDAGEISQTEYRKNCFELDKKYGIATAEDKEFYLGGEDENSAEYDTNLIGQVAVSF